MYEGQLVENTQHSVDQHSVDLEAGVAPDSQEGQTLHPPSQQSPTFSLDDAVNDKVMVIHIICSILGFLSFFFVFLEIATMIIIIVFYKQMMEARMDNNRYTLMMVDLLVNLIVGIFTTVSIAFVGLLSFGLGLVFLVFCIPYVVSCILLWKVYKKVKSEYIPAATF